MSAPIVTHCADREAVAARVAEVMAAAIDGARTIHGAAHVALMVNSTYAAAQRMQQMRKRRLAAAPP